MRLAVGHPPCCSPHDRACLSNHRDCACPFDAKTARAHPINCDASATTSFVLIQHFDITECFVFRLDGRHQVPKMPIL
jgi:hypothetical protein